MNPIVFLAIGLLAVLGLYNDRPASKTKPAKEGEEIASVPAHSTRGDGGNRGGKPRKRNQQHNRNGGVKAAATPPVEAPAPPVEPVTPAVLPDKETPTA